MFQNRGVRLILFLKCLEFCLSYGPPPAVGKINVIPQQQQRIIPIENNILTFATSNEENFLNEVKKIASSEPTNTLFWWQKEESPFGLSFGKPKCETGKCEQQTPPQTGNSVQQAVLLPGQGIGCSTGGNCALQPVNHCQGVNCQQYQPQPTNYGNISPVSQVPSSGSLSPSNCDGPYNCVSDSSTSTLCSGADYICLPKQRCQNGFVDKSTLNPYSLTAANSKTCFSQLEVCCKAVHVQPQSVGTYQDSASSFINVPSPPKSSGSSTSNSFIKQTNIIQTTSKPEPYTGVLNVTPYPGCAAALKCVPETYCTIDGVMSDVPVVLTKDLLDSRVPLSECVDAATGIVGKCCRDPNYKDPWPDHDHSHNHEHEHSSQEYSAENTINRFAASTEVPSNGFTIKKPLGVFKSKPTLFPTESNEKVVIDGQAYNTPNKAPGFYPTSQVSAYASDQQEHTQNAIIDNAVSSSQHSSNGPSQPNTPTGISFVTENQRSKIASNLPPLFLNKEEGVPISVGANNLPNLFNNVDTPYPHNVDTSRNNQQTNAVIKVTHEVPSAPSGQSSQNIIPPQSEALLPPFVSPTIYTNLECGSKINELNNAEVPWYASIYSTQNNKVFCDGAIISHNAILTAAHCLDKVSSDSVEVKVASKSVGTSYTFKVVTITRHPSYDEQSYSKDLAILLLKETINFNNYIQKICLPSENLEKNYFSKCLMTSSINPDTLRNTEVQLFPYNDCENKLKSSYLGKYFVLNKSFTCGASITDSDLCQAKIGSPVACNRGDGYYELYGVKSWDLGCQEYRKTAIFSNSDVAWITKVLDSTTEKLESTEQHYLRQSFKGETLEGVNIQEKPGFALGYGK